MGVGREQGFGRFSLGLSRFCNAPFCLVSVLLLLGSWQAEGRRLAHTSGAIQPGTRKDRLAWRAAYDNFVQAVRGDVLGRAEMLAAQYKRQNLSPDQDVAQRLNTNPRNTSFCDDPFWFPKPSVNVIPGFSTLILNQTKPELREQHCALACAMAIPGVVRHALSNTTAVTELGNLFGNPPHWALLWQKWIGTVFDRSCLTFSLNAQTGACTLLRRSCPTIGNTPRLRVPGAAAFCANNFARLGQVNDKLLVKQCQQAMSKASGGSGLEEYVCADECEQLVGKMRRDYDQVISPLRETSLMIEQYHVEPVLALGELCVRNVVRQVEAKNLQCCALGCGWSAANSSCSGLHLLPPPTLDRWWSECCNSGAVLRGSDRQRMCDAARPAVQALPSSNRPQLLGQPEVLGPRSPWQAFNVGQDLSDPRSSAEPGALLQDEAAVNQSPAGTQSTNSSVGLLDPCMLQCKMPWALETSLSQCAASINNRWFATASNLKCEQHDYTAQVETPEVCRQSSKTKGALYASWQFTPGKGRVEGTCRHFGQRCQRNWAIMTSASNKKNTISNVTDVMWLAVSSS